MNTNHRELLELAAKAAGMKVNFKGYKDFGVFDEVRDEYWDPLADDGDALRLAVKKQVFTVHYVLFLKFYHEELDNDLKPSVAARRAIVRAAAEIGEAIND